MPVSSLAWKPQARLNSMPDLISIFLALSISPLQIFSPQPVKAEGRPPQWDAGRGLFSLDNFFPRYCRLPVLLWRDQLVSLRLCKELWDTFGCDLELYNERWLMVIPNWERNGPLECIYPNYLEWQWQCSLTCEEIRGPYFQLEVELVVHWVDGLLLQQWGQP